ncbi:MAG TPA: transferrin receptor-like dimerization domain-containing protein [Gemmatimonadaceae bacterium]|nr:transferrin receptor-like dimerization domain-containing protein [Gemmatimonadaceae bacterium]
MTTPLHRLLAPAALAAGIGLAIAAPALPAQQQPIRGFPSDAVAAQARREAQLRAVPRADTLRARMRLLSEDPHEAGTDRSRRVAELIVAKFRAAGLDARIERFEALMPRPITRRLELVAPERYVATLAEKPAAGDKDAHDANQLPTYNAYSPDGDVTAPLVFVNYGLPDDYRVLDSLGVSVKGKIVIAKYGRSWRGIKPKLAAEHGAVGCIIYSDPEDDGYYVDDVYPEGPMRPWSGVQRGSVMDMPTYPGDPLSPGWASEPGARKLAMSEVKTIEPIPVLPISYEDALPLLRNIGGQVAPESWRGALPVTYKLGDGSARVHLALKFDWQTRPLYNAVARIPGALSPEQMVVYGNHHDAWVNGANDPISGMVAVEETARAFGALLKTGWRPARTIILAGWDGEEWGLLGSTEWAEKHKPELDAGGIAYLNSDTNGRGWLGIAGSHSLQRFMYEVARDVQDPVRKQSVLDAQLERRRATERRRAAREEEPAAAAPAAPVASAPADTTRRGIQPTDSVLAREKRRIEGERRPVAGWGQIGPAVDTSFTIGALGSGSDYTAFIDHVGLASLNIGFGGETRDGMYHSVHDTYDFYTRFLDTTFVYGVALAQTAGTTLLRLADAPVLPFEFAGAARTYRGYVEEIEKEARKDTSLRALDLSAVRAAVERLARASDRYEASLARLNGMSSRDVRARWSRLAAVNRTLYQTERALTDPRGLPGREWFRHLIYAPGFYTGYGVKTMPGIREAVEDKPDLAVAQREAARVAGAIDTMAAQVEKAAAGLEGVLR